MSNSPRAFERVYLSYASLDDKRGGGWVEELRNRLAAKLLIRLGWGVDIVGEDAADEDTVAGSGVLVVLLSGAYLHNVGTRDLDVFLAQQNAQQRLVTVAQEPPPDGSWPPPCDDVEPILFYGTSEFKHGRRHEPDSQAYDQSLEVLVDRVAGILEQLKPVVKPEPATDFTVFLATTSDKLQKYAKQLRRDLEQRHGVKVLKGVPPPWEAGAHDDAVSRAMTQADLAVHLLGFDYGHEIAGSDPILTYPMAQFQLGKRAPSQLALLWEDLPETLSELPAQDEDETAVAYRDFLIGIENSEAPRLSRRRVGRQQMASVVKEALLGLARKSPSPRTAFVNLHPTDARLAFELLTRLISHNLETRAVPDEGLLPSEGTERFAEHLAAAQLFVVFFGTVALQWVEKRLEEALKLVASRQLGSRLCVCVPSADRIQQVPFRGVVDVCVTSDPDSIEHVLRKLD